MKLRTLLKEIDSKVEFSNTLVTDINVTQHKKSSQNATVEYPKRGEKYRYRDWFLIIKKIQSKPYNTNVYFDVVDEAGNLLQQMWRVYTSQWIPLVGSGLIKKVG
jgi:hypothetical protein